MAKSLLTVRKRERTGKTGATKVRNEGLIPAVLYGREIEAIPVEVAPEDLKKALSTDAGRNTLLEIKVENSRLEKPALSLLKNVQTDFITGRPRHIDFYSIDPDTRIRVEVPLRFTGKCVGVRNGGILEEIERKLKIRCLPAAIPDFIEVDITELDISDSLHVRDIEVGDGLEVMNNPDDAVMMVIMARAAVSEAAQTTGEEAGEGEEDEGSADAAQQEGEDVTAGKENN